MVSKYNIAVFEGDGIGPEIMAPTIEILQFLQALGNGYYLQFKFLPAGAAHYSATGQALPKDSLDVARNCDAILLSAMGLPDVRYSDGTEISPQIDLRQELGLFAGVRPVTVRNSKHCPLARPNGQTIDFVIVRESTEGLFYSQGTGEVNANEARETMRITRQVSEKLFDFAMELAKERKAAGLGTGTVTCVDKANVFRAFAFFRSIFQERAGMHPELKAESAYVDAIALWMVQRPWSFDVLVTENMFGDILSDLGAGLMGGLGVAPSADIGENHAVFQPCHGSAPDIAGKGIANPLAMILSAAMMLEWLGKRNGDERMTEDSRRLKGSVESVLAEARTVTGDMGGTASTIQAAEAVKEKLKHQP